MSTGGGERPAVGDGGGDERPAKESAGGPGKVPTTPTDASSEVGVDVDLISKISLLMNTKDEIDGLFELCVAVGPKFASRIRHDLQQQHLPENEKYLVESLETLHRSLPTDNMTLRVMSDYKYRPQLDKCRDNIRTWMKLNPEWRSRCTESNLEKYKGFKSKQAEPEIEANLVFNNPAVVVELGLVEILRHHIEAFDINLTKIIWKGFVRDDRMGGSLDGYLADLAYNRSDVTMLNYLLSAPSFDWKENTRLDNFLYYAVINDCVTIDCFKALIVHPKVNLNAPEALLGGEASPLYSAVQFASRCGSVQRLSQCAERVLALLEAGADPNHVSLPGDPDSDFPECYTEPRTPLDIARNQLRDSYVYAPEIWQNIVQSAENQTDFLITAAVREANEESEGLREEIENLTQALENAKADRDKALEEIDDLKAAFDEAEKLAEELAGPKEEALRKELMDTHAREVEELKEELEGLTQANDRLKKMVDDLKESQSAALAKAAAAATAAASAMEEGQDKSGAREAELQAELDKAMSDLKLRENEAGMLRSDMERQIEKTTKELKKAEEELGVAKLQLSDTRKKLAQVEASRKVMKTPSPTAAKKKAQSSKFRPAPIPFGAADPLAKFSVESDDEDEDYDDDNVSGSVFYRSHARSRKRTPHSLRSRARSSSPTTVVRLESNIDRKSTKITALSKKVGVLGDQKKMSEVKIKNLEAEVKSLQSQPLGVDGDLPVHGAQKTILLAQAHHLRDEDEEVEGKENSVEEIIESRDPKRMVEELRSISKTTAALKEYNADLLQKILGLQGNIQVCCRVRPMMVSERQSGLKSSIEALSETEVGCFDARTKSWKSFAFDKVWGPESSQRGVFQDVEPLALSVVDGFNSCIFAYGQTGSGKTYTMDGMKEGNQHGVSHRTIKKIFNLLHLRSQQAAADGENRDPAEGGDETGSPFVFNIEVGMLEIYNDEVYDLLAPPIAASERKTHLDVRRGKDGLIEVPGLVKVKVSCLDDVMAVLTRGNDNRATASTNMNEHSSRSHMILNVRVTCGIKDQPMQTGNLYLIDLAGR